MEGFCVAKAHHGRLALRIVEEVQVVAALRHVDDVLAIERVAGGHVVYDLLGSQAVVVVGELRVGAGLYHAVKHAARLPGKRPAVVGQRIANGIVGDRLAVDGGHLVLPVRIAVDVAHGLRRRAQRARGVSVLAVGGDVAAPVIGMAKELLLYQQGCRRKENSP